MEINEGIEKIIETFQNDLASHGYQWSGKKKDYLGSGAFSHVYKCTNQNGAEFAAKIGSSGWTWIDKSSSETAAVVLKHIGKEVELLKLIGKNHPNLVRMEKEFRKRKLLLIEENLIVIRSHYIILEYADLGSFRQWLELNPRPEEAVIKYLARDLINAVDYIHSIGIVHGDIKPNNCLLFTNQSEQCGMTLKLCDFNLSQTTLETRDAVGTYTIRAPEVLRNGLFIRLYTSGAFRRVVSLKQADWWSVGATLFYALHGQFPLINDNTQHSARLNELFWNMATIAPNPEKMYDNLRQAQQPLDEFLSKPCRELMQRLLEPDPEKRVVDNQMVEAWIESDNPLHKITQMIRKCDDCIEEMLIDFSIQLAKIEEAYDRIDEKISRIKVKFEANQKKQANLDKINPICIESSSSVKTNDESNNAKINQNILTQPKIASSGKISTTGNVKIINQN